MTEFHLGPSAAATTKIKFKAGKYYPMKISGQRTKNVMVGSSARTFNEDAFSCYGSKDENVPDCADVQTQTVSLTARTAETTTLHPLQEFIPDGELIPNSQWRHPAFVWTHDYSFNYRPKLSGALVLASSETCAAPFRCTGPGFEVKIYPALPDDVDPCAAPTRARRAAVNEVRAVAVQPSVEVHKAGTPEDAWVPLCKDAVLQQGDEISCDPEGAATLQFADNSTVTVKNTTQLKIASFFTEGGVVKTEILLKMGEIAAKVHKSEATKSDFRIKSPTSVAAVRGTEFSVFYDPGSKATVTSVKEGTVEVDPEKDGLATASLTAGQEVEVTDKAASKVSTLGKAGARGGTGRKAALDKVLGIVSRASEACGVSTPRDGATSVKNAPGGWAVGVKLTGERKGTSQWLVKGKKVTAKNALAKKVSKRCK